MNNLIIVSVNVPISKNKHRKGHDRNRLKRTNIFIGGLFDLSGGRRPSGISELTAAKLAVAHINKRNILPGYRLRLLYNDTEVSGVCFILMYTKKTIEGYSDSIPSLTFDTV